MSNPVSKERIKIMQHGDVFAGTHKIKNNRDRRRIESERHNKFMDMMESQNLVSSGLPKNPNPVDWIKGYVKHKGIKKAKKDINEILKAYKTDDALAEPYFNSKNALKNKTFYMNALAYLKKNMEGK